MQQKCKRRTNLMKVNYKYEVLRIKCEICQKLNFGTNFYDNHFEHACYRVYSIETCTEHLFRTGRINVVKMTK